MMSRMLREQARENRQILADRESESLKYTMCAYFRNRGSCSTHECWEEPRCFTMEPMRGWKRPWVLGRR